MTLDLVEYPKEHIVIQGTDEWKALRVGKITGSKYKRIMPAKTLKDKTGWTVKQKEFLWGVCEEIITGESIENDFQSSYMENGNLMEPIARENIADHLLSTVRECGFFEVTERIGDSPDGLVGPYGKEYAALEIKCPSIRVHLHALDNKEWFWDEHKWQILGHMFATKKDTGFLVSFNNFMPIDKRMVICEPPEGYRDDIKLLEDRLMSAVELIEGWIK